MVVKLVTKNNLEYLLEIIYQNSDKKLILDVLQKVSNSYQEYSSNKNIKEMELIIDNLIADDNGRIFDIYSEDKCLYKCFVGWQNTYAFNLYSTKTKDSNLNNWNGSYIFWEIFCYLSQKGVKFFDFEGVNSPKRGWYKESFGGHLMIYFDINVIINE